MIASRSTSAGTTLSNRKTHRNYPGRGVGAIGKGVGWVASHAA